MIEAKKKLFNLHDKMKKLNKPENKNNYKLQLKKYRKLLKNNTNDNEKEKIKAIDNIKSASEFYRDLTFKEDSIGVLKDKNVNSDTTRETLPGQDTLKALYKTHFPAHTYTMKTIYNNFKSISTESLTHQYREYITLSNLKSAFQGFDNKKSPGPDGLKPILLKHLPNNILKILLVIYKTCIALHYTPIKWKATKVIFIPKNDKDAYDIPKNFRPVSLSNYLLKTLERLLGWHMNEQLKLFPIHQHQHGFCSDKSTESAISNVINYIENHTQTPKQHCVAISLDIQAAFDSIDPKAIRDSLLKHGGQRDMIIWYFNYLTHRDLESTFHNETFKATTLVGFPQGGVVSADFWKIVFDPAIQIINNKQVTGYGYADDLILLRGGINHNTSLNYLQSTLDKLIKWGQTCSLKFNPQKTMAVIFGKRNKIPPSTKLLRVYIDNKQINFVENIKYLGVTLDPELNWKTHKQNVIKQAKKNIMMVNAKIKQTCGLNPELARWVFVGVIRPKLCYASLLWAHTINSQKDKNTLEKLNRLALLTFNPVRNTIATNSLEVIYNVMPLDIHLKMTAIMLHVRLYKILTTNIETSNNKGHLGYWTKLCEQFQLNYPLTDKCKDTIWTHNYSVQVHEFKSNEYKQALTPSEINIFTDGSKTKQGVGAGLAIYKQGQLIKEDSFSLPHNATIFQAEIQAIRQSIRAASKSKPKYIKIFSDSQAALQEIDNFNITSTLVRDTIMELNTLGRNSKKLSLIWIKAHVQHKGNEKADALAKQGTILATHETEWIRTPLADNTVKQTIKGMFHSSWQIRWSEDESFARHTKVFLSNIQPNISKSLLKLSPTELTNIIHAITSHNNLKYFSNKLNNLNDVKCRLCNEDNTIETFQHILNECPITHMTRQRLLQGRQITSQSKWNPQTILQFLKTNKVWKLFRQELRLTI